jgi:integrase
MSKFTGSLATLLEDMINYKEALGFSRYSYEGVLLNLDRFCIQHFPNETALTKEIVVKWMEKRPTENVRGPMARSHVIRQLGKYLNAVGIEAYILPDKYIGGKSAFTPYIFTDSELKKLFTAADNMKPSTNTSIVSHVAIPVILRLIYTCGLRPNEGRELKRKNLNLDNGEILITGTKKHTERIVVMSDDMLKLCKTYDIKRSVLAPDNEYFFPNHAGGAYSRNWLSYHFNGCWRAANAELDPKTLPDVRVYDLRHRFASAVLNRWLDEKKDLYAMIPYLRAYMGHSDINATLYYVHLLPENLIKSAGLDWDRLNSVIPEVSVCQE